MTDSHEETPSPPSAEEVNASSLARKDNARKEALEGNEREPKKQKKEDPMDRMARKEILLVGMNFPETGPVRKLTPTVQILTDGLINWSDRDTKCMRTYKKIYNIKTWIHEIREQRIQVFLPITVIALQCVRQLECLEPLKNALIALCKTIRINNPGGRIFVCTNIPNPRSVPVVAQRTSEHNGLVTRAMRSVNSKLRRIFLAAMAEHFISQGEFIQPLSQYFTKEGELTEVGCFIYRSCLFKEIGIMPYHLDYNH